MLAVIKNQQLGPTMPSSAELNRLWRQAREGDDAAFEQVYRATVGVVYGLCLRMTANPAQAEESTQRTFIKAWQHLREYRGDARLSTWLHRIAVNEVLGSGRWERRYRRFVNEFAVSTDIYQTPNGNSDHDLERAIALLPPRARQVFVLHAVYGYQHDETADLLDIAIGTSKAHYHRARQLLQNALGDNHAPTI